MRAESGNRKVLLVGWDAADWKVIDPLLEEGKMPFLRHLIEQGVRANLATIQPVLSPMLWTSIATGKRPYKHGIYGFAEPKPDRSGIRPVSSLSRTTKAIWNILTQNGLCSNIIGWWPSHPAESINGVMVSNHYHRAFRPLEDAWPMAPGTVHPQRLSSALAEIRYHPSELGGNELLPFIPSAAEIDPEKDARLAMCAKILAEATTIQAAATYLLEEEPWDFTAVYFDSIDHWCHAFMRYHPPKQEHITVEDFEMYHRIISTAYMYHDAMLRNLVALAGENTTVIVISDHGFHSDHLRQKFLPREPAGPALEHRDFGILVMHGPGITAGKVVHGASILDITPTILSLFSLPVADDFDGCPIGEALEHPPCAKTIPSWDKAEGEHSDHAEAMRDSEGDSRQLLDQLVDLGYIDKPPDNVREAIREAEQELQYNRSRAYMDDDYYEAASAILEELVTHAPDEYRFAVNLAFCYRSLQRYYELKLLVESLNERKSREVFEARELLKEWNSDLRGKLDSASEQKTMEALLDENQRKQYADLRARASINPFTLKYLLAYAELHLGNSETALELLQDAEKTATTRIGLHLLIAEAFLKLKQWEKAERRFEHALKLDPDHPIAHLGLCRSYLPRNRHLEAAGAALRSVNLKYHYPLGHYHLGLAYWKLGRLQQAVASLETALSQNPNFEEAHRRLVTIFQGRLKNALKAELHRETAKRLRKLSREEKRQLRKQAGGRNDAMYAALASAPDVRLHFPESLITREAEGQRGDDHAGAEALPSKRPIPVEPITIVTGLPRSGTSLMMQMPEAGGLSVLKDDERKPNEANPRGYYEFKRVRNLNYDKAWLFDAAGKCVKVVSPLIRFLVDGFNYRFVFMERDLREVIASQRTMLRKTGRRGARIDEEDLLNLYERQLKDVGNFLRLAGYSVVYVDFRECILNPAKVGGRLSEFFDGGFDIESAKCIVDPTLYRQRMPNE